MNKHEQINYLEFPASNIIATKDFFSTVFNWQFKDYGNEYTAFSSLDAGVNGGFYISNKKSLTKEGSVLVVFYSKDLSATKNKIENAGGKISKDTYSFPGGQRFHFTDPSGNEFAVWSDKTD